MREMVAPYYPRQHNYALRQEGQNFILPQCRTSSYYNSFLPATIRLWNELDHETKNSPTISSFKVKLDKKYKPNTPPKHFDYGIRKFNIMLCQLRNEASDFPLVS